jgi:hypothetical protein
MSNIQRRRFSIQDAVIGSMLILIGTILLLQQLDVFYLYDLGIRSIWQLWPFIFVVIGIGKLADAPTLYHIGKGLWLVFLGLWLYVSINHVYGLSFSETWPAILIVWGVSMMWESFTKESKKFYKEENYGKQ